MKDHKLTFELQNMIDQVAASMAIENMYLSEDNKATLQRIVTDEITEDESIAETIRKYTHA